MFANPEALSTLAVRVSKWKPVIASPSPGRAFVVAAFDQAEELLPMERDLASAFGAVDYSSHTVAAIGYRSLYGFTPRSQLRLLSFSRPVAREELVDMRRRTLAIEQRRQRNGRPLVELDPGYITLYGAVRSSLDEGGERIYLYGGIYAEQIYRLSQMRLEPTRNAPPLFHQGAVATLFNDLHIIVQY